MDTNGTVSLDTGELTLEQINLILTNLPVDVTFIDEYDEVRYYSQKEKPIYPRSPEIIGQPVINCHSPQSYAKVEALLEDLRSGKSDVIESWAQADGQIIHIRYFAIRDKENNYKGCMEVFQDVTQVRAHEGE